MQPVVDLPAFPLFDLPAELPPVLWVDGWPILYEDEEDGEMGENNVHVEADEILHVCLSAHFAHQPDRRVFSNMNLYYRDGPPDKKSGAAPYVSPDLMIVEPFEPLPHVVPSYTIGRDGPASLLVAEILSKRSYQQRDLREKLVIYAKLGVQEYILVDVTGQFLPDKLVLKRLDAAGVWHDERDPDGGVTSQLGFRLIIDEDDNLRVVDTATGKKYVRPMEAEALVRLQRQIEERLRAETEARQETEEQLRAETEARQKSEEQLRAETEARQLLQDKLKALEAELARLRGSGQISWE